MDLDENRPQYRSEKEAIMSVQTEWMVKRVPPEPEEEIDGEVSGTNQAENPHFRLLIEGICNGEWSIGARP